MEVSELNYQAGKRGPAITLADFEAVVVSGTLVAYEVDWFILFCMFYGVDPNLRMLPASV